MTDTTPTTVATPMMTPRSVRNARILCLVNADEERRKSSTVLMSLPLRGGRRGRPLLLVPFLLLVHDDLVAFLDLAEDLEGPGHDVLPDGRAFLDFDHELAGQSRLDLLELELAALDEIDPLFGVRPSRRGRGLLVLLRHVADDERLDRDRGGALVAAGDDLGGDGEARADGRRRILDADLDLEVDRFGARHQGEEIRVVLGDRRGPDFGDDTLELLARIGVDRQVPGLPDLDLGHRRL